MEISGMKTTNNYEQQQLNKVWDLIIPNIKTYVAAIVSAVWKSEKLRQTYHGTEYRLQQSICPDLVTDSYTAVQWEKEWSF